MIRLLCYSISIPLLFYYYVFQAYSITTNCYYSTLLSTNVILVLFKCYSIKIILRLPFYYYSTITLLLFYYYIAIIRIFLFFGVLLISTVAILVLF